MKRTAAALLVLASVTSFLYAQTSPSAKLRKDYIDVFGTRLRIGMTKADVAEKLSGAEIIRVHEDSWLVGPEKSTSSVQFKNGRLTFADRSWGTKNGDVAEELFGAVNSINSEGYSQCHVFADTRSFPEMTTQRVWMQCGNKSLLVLRTSYINGHTYNEVSEQLGTMREFSD